ncbi:MAG: DUF4214 domain-containing protein, partial [Rhodobacteraceae bacterium]|nr:DUF4214 domain-containing protein [Paracoccaceae bacterium]
LVATEGSLYTYVPTATDLDGDIPTIDVVGSSFPSWISFDPNTGGISGTPLQANVGMLANDVILVISDGNGGSASQTFNIDVADINNAPMGDVVITGTAAPGETLTADTSAVADADGLAPFSYQWQLDGQPIAGALGSTYDLTAQDVGDITVVVTYTDLGNTLETLTSAPRSVSNTVITGTPGPDSLVGMAGDETLIGLEDNDTLDGGGGIDRFEGGPGNDLFILSDPSEQVIELVNEGLDTVRINSSFILPANVEDLELIGSDAADGTGNALDNQIIGNTGNNALSGLSGDDTLSSTAGDDTLLGGPGDDTYLIDNENADIVELANEGADRVITPFTVGLGPNLEHGILNGTDPGGIVGNAQDNILIGNSNSNILIGSAGNDTLDGGAGTDALFDGEGIDSLVGGADNDLYVVGETGDVVFELANEGTDIVVSYAPDFTLPENVEHLILSDLSPIFFQARDLGNPQDIRTDDDVQAAENAGLGAVALAGFDDSQLYADETRNLFESLTDRSGTGNALDNIILGDMGANVLSGLDGDDTIEGGAGNDVKTGGGGTDVFKYTAFTDGDASFFGGEGITDFVAGTDKIDISELILSQGSASFNAAIAGLETRGFTFIGDSLPTGEAGQVSITQSGDLALVIVASGSDSVEDLSFFVRVTGTLSQSDFILSPLDTDSTRDMLTNGATLDYSNTETTTWVADETFDSAIGLGFGFGDNFRLRAAYDQTGQNPSGEFDGRLGGFGGNGSVGTVGFEPGQNASFDGGFIIGASFLSFSTRPFESSEPGAPSQAIVLDIDRNLDGVKDFELELQGDYRGAQFRTELINGDINISLFEGNSAPTGEITIDGDLGVFEEVSINTDNLFDRDGIDLSTVEFQWFNNGEAIADATEGDYRLRLSDVGDVINVQLTYTDMFGTQEQVMSQTVGPVPASDRSATGEVTIDGTARQGETLAIDISEVRDPDIPDPRTAQYQWLRDGTEIAGATGFDYELTQDDVGAAISVRFNITDLGGSSSTFTSAATGAVENINDVAGGVVTIDGSVSNGQIVSANLDGIDDPDGTTNIAQSASFQWLRGGNPIAGATSQQYTVGNSDVAQVISVRVDFLDDTGASETLTSAGKFGLGSDRVIEGTPGPDTLRAGVGNDLIRGLESDDVITSSFGNDTIDGGEGTDRVILSGDQSKFTVVLSQSGVTVDDRDTDPFNNIGTKFLTNVELLDFGTEEPAFGGQPVDLTQFGNVADLSESDFTDFIELYIAYFNRAPDAIGLFFWGSQLAKGFTLEEIATLFFDQDETRATYPDLSDVETFAKQVYDNVLGREFDQAGIDFWVGVLSSGAVSLPTFMLEIIKGAKAPPQPGDSPELTAQKLIDVAYLSNKTDLGAYFSVIKGMSNVENARDALEFYDGTQASIDGSKGIIDGFFEDAQDAATGEFLFQLTGVVDDPFAIA